MKRKGMCVALAVLAGGWAIAADETRWLDEFPLESMSCGMRLRPQANRSVTGKPLRMGSATNVYARGVGTKTESAMIFEADGRVKAFDAVVGFDWGANEYAKSWDTGHNWGGVRFRVYADDEIVADSGVILPDGQPKRLHVELQGKKMIVLEATDRGDWAGYRFGHADWAEARFTCADGAMLKPHSDKSLAMQLGILTPPVRDVPQINGPSVYGVRPGHPILYRLPVSGLRPLQLAASGLPDGVTFDAEKGILSGSVATAGEWTISFTARNTQGEAKRLFTLKVGETISLTPPMGWNHWNIYGSAIQANLIRETADAMVASGLADHGWAYVNIDDGWNRKPDLKPGRGDGGKAGPTRNADGTVRPCDSFADMKGLADYVHAYGLKLGIYSSPGATTCGGFEGSLGHEEIDAKTYADWGIDYLKHDWCSYGSVFGRETKGRKPTVDDYAKPYRKMSAALRAQNRDIIHAFCQYGMGDVQSWGRAAGAQVWRSHGDLKDDWMGVVNAVDSYGETAWQFTGPGFWCDPDMLVVGVVATHSGHHDSDLTPNEQYTHISLWCMLNAPLLLGCDLTRLDAFTKGLLVNDEVLAVHQDVLGRTARRVIHTDSTDVWTRPLADGSFAVAVVNRFPYRREVALDFAAAGFKPSAKPDCNCPGENLFAVRDLWRQRDLGVMLNAMTLDVPSHATVLLRLVRK